MTPRAGVDDPRWEALRARDPRAAFFYSVKTTGIYCRPSCGSRPARPENVSFHESAAAAESAGFRPCRRCQPGLPPLAERHAAQVAALCRYIESSDAMPSLAELAERAGISAFHLHRVFKAVTGVTPKAWADANRGRRLRAELATGGPVTEAIYGAGFQSSGRFYEQTDALLGMTPRAFRDGGADMDIRFAIAACSLGAILVAATARGICAITMGDDPEALAHDLQRRFPRARIEGADAGFDELVARVVGLVEHPNIGADLPLDVRGTAFQQQVWQALCAIPPGKTATYAEIAAAIGAPKAVRAVAAACAANALAVAVPCHRVVRTDGGLSGYRWGVERKRALLDREAEAS